MSKGKIIKRLDWLYSTEKFFAYVFTGIIIFLLIRFPKPEIIFLLYGLILVTVVLFQGQHYWKLKLYRLSNQPFNQKKSLGLFRKAKRLNLIMAGMIPLIMLAQQCLTGWTGQPDIFFSWAVFANFFGILEHINYFHRQLMIDNVSDLNYLLRHKKLKTSSLKKDLDKNSL